MLIVLYFKTIAKIFKLYCAYIHPGYINKFDPITDKIVGILVLEYRVKTEIN